MSLKRKNQEPCLPGDQKQELPRPRVVVGGPQFAVEGRCAGSDKVRYTVTLRHVLDVFGEQLKARFPGFDPDADHPWAALVRPKDGKYLLNAHPTRVGMQGTEYTKNGRATTTLNYVLLPDPKADTAQAGRWNAFEGDLARIDRKLAWFDAVIGEVALAGVDRSGGAGNWLTGAAMRDLKAAKPKMALNYTTTAKDAQQQHQFNLEVTLCKAKPPSFAADPSLSALKDAQHQAACLPLAWPEIAVQGPDTLVFAFFECLRLLAVLSIVLDGAMLVSGFERDLVTSKLAMVAVMHGTSYTVADIPKLSLQELVELCWLVAASKDILGMARSGRADELLHKIETGEKTWASVGFRNRLFRPVDGSFQQDPIPGLSGEFVPEAGFRYAPVKTVELATNHTLEPGELGLVTRGSRVFVLFSPMYTVGPSVISCQNTSIAVYVLALGQRGGSGDDGYRPQYDETRAQAFVGPAGVAPGPGVPFDSPGDPVVG